MLAFDGPSARVGASFGCWEDVLPRPELAECWVLALEGAGDPDLAEALLEIFGVKDPDRRQVVRERRPQHAGEHRHPILLALPVPHCDLIETEVDVLHA